MIYSATITSKRQLTIPAKLFTKIGLTEGQQVLLSEQDGELCLKPAVGLVEELAGSVSVPKNLSQIDIDLAVRKAKEARFVQSGK